ncbi:hypothetical protein KXD40_001888 [Peronospora effusa]|uniref:Single-strand DNA deaminase toxin A-like C-terminal domain-containing protein n=1 Tax=Peronospora effusa TaxID=542832 RepID=A0A3M6VMN0_9STRA|nr:hypothetical protein DD238_001775 [Peronospora effusa]RQM14180.1 hypothetical protein DD237_003488 [Peronospora effusa]UIZ27181.1 hypothetical protein KXD40_001888 [Peronospora effusa]CAI5704646.1 unnamed protein product [Peronospora effusa]
MTPLKSAVAMAPARYFSFKDFLSEAEAAAFFEVSHAEQVAKVEQYLEFLGQQPNSTQFSASSKASISSAELREDSAAKSYPDDGGTFVLDAALLQQVLDGRTRSGFGAFGTEPGFLPQKRLSLTVAHVIEEIGHTYIVERNKRGIVKPPVLNSRSFFFYWCHAEKQKLMDIREKLNAKKVPPQLRCLYWQRIVIVVDRAMCDDCVRFVECFARFEKACICIRDPDVTREFSPSTTLQVS